MEVDAVTASRSIEVDAVTASRSIEVDAVTASRSCSPATPDEDAHQPGSDVNFNNKQVNLNNKQVIDKEGTMAVTSTVLSPNDELRPADADQSLASDSAGSDSVTENSLITKEMMEEEKKMHQETMNKEEEFRKQGAIEVKTFTAEDRYNRLKMLLTKSQLYSSYLANRMKQQATDEQKRKDRLEKRATKAEAGKKKKDDVTTNQDSQTGTEASPEPVSKGRSLRAQSGNQTDSQSSQGSQKKGRKRKNEDDDLMNNSKIEDFFVGSKRKRRKKNEATEEPEPSPENDVNEKENNSDDRLQITDMSTKDNSMSPSTKNTVRTWNGEVIHEDQPKLLTGGVLRKYQVDGFLWLKGLYENGVNGILADEMGLGKTIQCIALISHLVAKGINGPFFVCAPLSTVPNWVAEFKRFAPEVPVMLYHGSKEERAKLRAKMNPNRRNPNEVLPAIVTSYEITMNDRVHIMDKDWKILIVDEGHRIKNFQCRLITELKMYKATHRLLLTGTPLQNNLSELWSLLNFLLPEIFDDLGSFEAWFDLSMLKSSEAHADIVKEEQQKNVLGTIHQILTPFMLRRLKSDIDLCIPPKREILVYAPLSQKQQEMLKAIADKTIRKMLGCDEEEPEPVEMDSKGRPMRRARKNVNYEDLLAISEETNDKRNKKNDNDDDDDDDLQQWFDDVLKQQQKRQEREGGSRFDDKQQPQGAAITIQMRNIMFLLRKSCNHPYLIEYPLTVYGEYRIDNDLITASGKFMLLDRMLPELERRGHKVLIFSQMTSILDLLGDYCYLKGYKFCRLDGTMNFIDRMDQIDSFNTDPDIFVFLLSTRAGGLGINLTAADTCIIFDSDWNPQCDLQAQDRCHRIGQTKPVLIYRLVTANTIDQKIVERAAAKRKLEKMVIHKGQFKQGLNKDGVRAFSAITPEELLRLLQEIDYDKVVKQDTVISDKELNSLLDRTDLSALWDKQRNQDAAEKSEDKKISKTKASSKKQLNKNAQSEGDLGPKDVEGLFKIIVEDDGSTDNKLSAVNADNESDSISENSSSIEKTCDSNA